MKQSIVSIIAVAILIFCSNAVLAENYQIISTERSMVGDDLIKTVATVQVGSNCLNRFLMTRVTKDVPHEAIKGIILLLPHLGGGFQNYETSDNGEYDKSFVAFFANRNYDVWGYSQRSQMFSAGSCESGVVDCSIMADWGFQTLVDDTAFVRAQIEIASPGKKTVVGGISMGSAASIMVVNSRPDDYAGMILIDGSVYDENPEVRAITSNYCSMFQNLLASRVYYDGQGLAGLKLINSLAMSDPDGLSPIPGMPAGTTNRQAFISVSSTSVVSPTSPRPGYFFAAGSVEEGRLFYSNEAYWHAGISSFIDYIPIKTFVDMQCQLAGETTFVNNLHNFKGSAIIFAAGHGFGTSMLDTARLMPQAKITMNYASEYGHVDYYFNEYHREVLEEPILKWLRKDILH